MNKLIFVLFGIFLVGCSSAPQVQRINLGNNVEWCTVYSTYAECKLFNGNIYYADMLTMLPKISYDKSAWKENINYCPMNLNLSNITNISQQCNYKRVCWNEEKWVEC
jgi:hypothetical protein